MRLQGNLRPDMKILNIWKVVQRYKMSLISNVLQGDFPKLQEEIRTEANEREEVDNTLIKKTNEESQKMVEII